MTTKTKPKRFPQCYKCGGNHAPPEPRCTRYNGWSNYETWVVNLWLTNEQETAKELSLMADPKILIRGEKERAPLWRRAEFLKDWVEEMMPDLGASLASDLLGAALSEVDWQEIIENHEGDNV